MRSNWDKKSLCVQLEYCETVETRRELFYDYDTLISHCERGVMVIFTISYILCRFVLNKPIVDK